jgi:hypothetical protein
VNSDATLKVSPPGWRRAKLCGLRVVPRMRELLGSILVCSEMAALGLT